MTPALSGQIKGLKGQVRSLFRLFLVVTLSVRILLLVVAIGCRTAAVPVTEEVDVARRYLGGELDTFPNRTGTYILCVQRAVPGQSTKFVVIERASRSVVEEGTYLPGYVEWKGNDTIEVLSVPGTLKKGEDLSRYIRTIRLLPKN